MRTAFCFFCVCALPIAAAWAGDSKKKDKPQPSAESARTKPATPVKPEAKPNKPGGKLPAFTPEREAAATTFVKSNHAELMGLLKQLKASNPDGYELAIRELFRASEDLSRIKDQDPDRYALELEAWKLKSRIELLAARASIKKDKHLEKELRGVLNKQMDARLQLMELQVKQAADRLKKLQEALEKLTQDRDQQVERQYQTILRGIEKARVVADKAKQE